MKRNNLKFTFHNMRRRTHNYTKPVYPPTKTKHSFLVFSIPNTYYSLFIVFNLNLFFTISFAVSCMSKIKKLNKTEVCYRPRKQRVTAVLEDAFEISKLYSSVTLNFESRDLQIRKGRMNIHEMNIHEMNIHEMNIHEMNIHEMNIHEMNIHEAIRIVCFFPIELAKEAIRKHWVGSVVVMSAF